MKNVAILVLLLAVAATLGTVSCTPKSAMVTKAVIIDSDSRTTDAMTSYKVKLLTYDVIDYHIAYAKYDIGDTVLVHDRYRNLEIR